MNCITHTNEPAVAQCGSCGSGLCKDCVDHSAYTIDNKPLCKDCNIKLAQELIDTNNSILSSSKIKLIITGVFFVIGAIMFLIGLAGATDDPSNVKIWGWIIMGIGGIPSVFSTMKTSQTDKAVDEVQMRYDASNAFVQIIIRFLVRIALTLLLAPIAAIWHIFKNWKKWKDAEAQIHEHTLTLQALTNA